MERSKEMLNSPDHQRQYEEWRNAVKNKKSNKSCSQPINQMPPLDPIYSKGKHSQTNQDWITPSFDPYKSNQVNQNPSQSPSQEPLS
jgi:hypothetical protein